MAIWLFRAGSNGEYEKRFLEDGKIYLTWDKLNLDLSKVKNKEELKKYLVEYYDMSKKGRIRNWASQIWPMAHRIKEGDWVILPSKLKRAIHIGEVLSAYRHESSGDPLFQHQRDVRWFATDIPRSRFDQDLLHSLGAFMTVCRITRNKAEERIKNMAENNWQVTHRHLNVAEKGTNQDAEIGDTDELPSDLEIDAKDQIAKYLQQRFRGHQLTRLINAILKAKGYVTYQAPEGPDKGVDILAAPEPMGFGSPKICVQVKSGDDPVDRATLDQLIGVMHNFKAEHGLFVSWGGYKSSVDREIPSQFFNVRLWGQDEIISELFQNYQHLDNAVQADIPLKQAWVLNWDEVE
ncbi:MAG: restriction endonuclease [Schleiferiaceae bacterium]|nr:restriction endonuclease [Schleiferiaceae bacterium]